MAKRSSANELDRAENVDNLPLVSFATRNLIDSNNEYSSLHSYCIIFFSLFDIEALPTSLLISAIQDGGKISAFLQQRFIAVVLAYFWSFFKLHE